MRAILPHRESDAADLSCQLCSSRRLTIQSFAYPDQLPGVALRREIELDEDGPSLPLLAEAEYARA